MKYMNFKNVVIFILSLTTVWIVVVFFCYKGYLTNIKVGQIQLDDCPYFTTQDSVVFDTGADFSYISSNKIGFPFFYFQSWLTMEKVIIKFYQCISHNILKLMIK